MARTYRSKGMKFIMNINEIKTYLETNKDSEEVKAFTGSFINDDTIKAYLESENGKKVIQPTLDSNFTKGLETWKKNNLTKLVDEEFKKKYPTKSEKDMELEALKAEIEKMKSESTRKELTNTALKVATEKGLPVEFLDHFIADNEENTLNNLKKLEDVFNKSVTKAVESRLKDGYKPPKTENKTEQETLEEQVKKYMGLK